VLLVPLRAGAAPAHGVARRASVPRPPALRGAPCEEHGLGARTLIALARRQNSPPQCAARSGGSDSWRRATCSWPAHLGGVLLSLRRSAMRPRPRRAAGRRGRGVWTVRGPAVPAGCAMEH